MQKTPKANRLHIGIFGKRNVGKSKLMNTITNQEISIVSDTLGTTTDPVEKSMEFLPLGPVVFIDTAGIDDVGELGNNRIERTKKIIDRIDIAIIVCDYNGWNNYEIDLFNEFSARNIPTLAIINKQDIKEISEESFKNIQNYVKEPLKTSLLTNSEIVLNLKQQLIKTCPEDFITPPSILEGLVNPKDTVVLVIPIDKEAPKGRLILPQAQILRDILDNNCKAFVTQVEELASTLNELRNKPQIVITDSQAFNEVNKIVPQDINLTSFSILFAKLKGDLKEFYIGAKSIDTLKDGDKILICESCTHHQIDDDIARVKIPKLLKNKTKKDLDFVYKSGHNFEENIKDYALVIHCGACMTNKKEILTRIIKCKNHNVPITNFGIAIAHCLNILERAIKPFNILDNRE